MRRAVLLSVLLVAGAVPPASASTALSAVAYGAVDLGDLVAYRVDGPGCETASVRVVVTADGSQVVGPASSPLVDGTDPSGCTGLAQVPSFADVTAAGWLQGEPIDVELTSGDATVPLRFFRYDVDRASVVAGAPAVVPSGDQDTGDHDAALVMNTGDVVDLGPVDVRTLRSFGFRICAFGVDKPYIYVQDGRHEVPAIVTVTQGSPDGPALIGPIDVASNFFTSARLSTVGFHGCYRLVELPFKARPISDAPRLFLRVDRAGPDMLRVNSIDFNGTGAKLPAPPQTDPPGTRMLFDGTTLDGMTHRNCEFADGAATRPATTNPFDITDCVLMADEPVRDVIVRFELRPESFFDNGALYMPGEIQLWQQGEFGTGGYWYESGGGEHGPLADDGYAARAHRINSFPDWSQMEVVQLGARYVVSVNGRTVTDHVAKDGAPDPYRIGLQTQAQWSWHAGAETGFGQEGYPRFTGPANWGRYWFRNVRVYECSSQTDPICVAAADARAGQVPAR